MVQDGAVRCSALNHAINAVLYCVVGARFRMELFGVLHSTMLINAVLYCVVGARFRMELFGVLHSTMQSMQFCTV